MVLSSPSAFLWWSTDEFALFASHQSTEAIGPWQLIVLRRPHWSDSHQPLTGVILDYEDPHSIRVFFQTQLIALVKYLSLSKESSELEASLSN